jgi:RNA polymerase sigma-70 factor (ECF subfamily)
MLAALASGRFVHLREIDPRAMTSAPPKSVVDPDRVLLGRAAGRDERALEELYDRYSGPLYAVAYRIAGERADAEEIVLETFAQVWREAARFQADKGSVVAWLTMICRSRALDLVRARGRRIKLADKAVAADPDQIPGIGTPGADSETQLAQGERARRVSEALALLSPPQREAIELAYYEGLSHSEIAERQNQPLGTVKTRVRLAMDKLRNALRPYYFEATA